MAALTRSTFANYTVHENITVDTLDNEDHTFCGVVFPISVQTILPLQHVVINSVSVRGRLGELSVWISNEDARTHPLLQASAWTRIYQAKHAESIRDYAELTFPNPVTLYPGQVRLLYIHSTRPGDEAIVYDNSTNGNNLRHDDGILQIHTGKAHLSKTPFGRSPLWGWGNAWRDHREFVGRVSYGLVYQLWHPTETHSLFGSNFASAVRTLLLLQRTDNNVFCNLPDECLHYIMHLCKWDWFDDTMDHMRNRHGRRRVQQQQQQQVANVQAALPQQAPNNNGAAMPVDGNNDEEEEAEWQEDHEEEESSDEEEEEEYAEEWQRHSIRRFHFVEPEPLQQNNDNDQEQNVRVRRLWFRHQFARVFLHRDNDNDSEEDSDDASL